jgi:hypothetical protein
MVAALKTRRNSIGIELDTEYCRMAASRLLSENGSLFSHADLQIQLRVQPAAAAPPTGVAPSLAVLREAPAAYNARKLRKGPNKRAAK